MSEQDVKQQLSDLPTKADLVRNGIYFGLSSEDDIPVYKYNEKWYKLDGEKVTKIITGG